MLHDRRERSHHNCVFKRTEDLHRTESNHDAPESVITIEDIFRLWFGFAGCVFNSVKGDFWIMEGSGGFLGSDMFGWREWDVFVLTLRER